MTDEEVMAALRSDTMLNKARLVFSGECGRIEQAAMGDAKLATAET